MSNKSLYWWLPEAYLEPCQLSIEEPFAKIVNMVSKMNKANLIKSQKKYVNFMDFSLEFS